ncbi:MAG: SusD/RagB family nutrient-binding outer membrane lipoprotein, partial [Muribaculaceae bacterium]|nr:SusD/RagB family nutrient-binding outer membrane lipoprotein [Muribaculaceae bacterium]
MKKHAILYVLASMFLALTMVSCDDYLDVNKNEDAPEYVDAHIYLAGIQQEYFGLYWDIRALAPLTQMMGTSSYTSFATHYYSLASDAGGELWRMVYWNQGKNLENMINQSEAAGAWHLAGIGYAMKAFSWDALTKYHGEVIMEDAFKDNQLTHHYDYQEDVYKQVRAWADKAIEYLQKADDTNYGNKISGNDWIYSGNLDKWIKFAYAVKARNLASLSNKRDFKEKYYAEFTESCEKAFSSGADDAVLSILGGSANAAESAYNNFWGPYRGNLSNVYWQHDYAVQLMTGTIPVYNEDGDKIKVDGPSHPNYPFELAGPDINLICDTLPDVGHFDPRPLVKLATTDGNPVVVLDANGTAQLSEDSKDAYTDRDLLRNWTFIGSGFTSASGPVATAPMFWGRTEAATSAKDGNGRWLYRDDAPYIMMTYGELLFDRAEIEFKYGSKAKALECFKKAVAADMEFTAKYIVKGSNVIIGTGKSAKAYHQGDKVDAATFKLIANEYLAGPYVAGLTEGTLTLSHIMMQKFIHL